VPEAGGTMPVVMTHNRAALSHPVLTGIGREPLGGPWRGKLAGPWAARQECRLDVPVSEVLILRWAW